MRTTLFVLFLLPFATPRGAHAQDPPSDPQAQAAEALRTLYEPGGLTAEQVVQQALATSPNLERARSLVLQARGGAKQAWAALVPNIELSAAYRRLSPVVNGGISGSDPSEIDMLIDQVQDPAAQSLFRGFTTFEFPVILDNGVFDAFLQYPITAAFTEVLPTLKAAKLDKEAAKYRVLAERASVALSAQQAFYEYARAKAAKAVADASLEESVAQQVRMKSLVEAGTAPRVDLLRVDAQVAASEVALARAELGLAVAIRSLQALVHSDEVVSLGEDLSEPVTGLPQGMMEDLQAQAFERRPDMHAVKASITARQKQVRGTKGGMYPELILQGNARYANPNVRIFPLTQTFKSTWEVGAAVRWSPNDTVDGHGRKDRARAALIQAEADLTTLEDGIKVEVAQGYHGLRAARTALESAVLGLAAASESYRVRRLQLDAGIVNTTDLLQTKAELDRARLELVASAVGLRIARATLERAIGEVP